MPYDFEDPEMWEAATYALLPLSEEQWREPDRSGKLVLTVHRELTRYVLSCGGKDFSEAKVVELADRFSRNKREMVMEWVRLNLGELEDFFKRVESERGLARHPGTYYVEPRMIFRRCTGRVAPRVESIDRRRVEVGRREAEMERRRIARVQWRREEIMREFDQKLKTMDTRLRFYEQKAADDDEEWPKLSWRGQIPESLVSSSRKDSMNDLRAVEFKRRFARGEVVPAVSVDPVRFSEANEGDPCEPTAKRRKRSRGAGKVPASAKPVPRWAAEEDDAFDLQINLCSDELQYFP